ncbi:MAG: rhodanese-like domain-containing protein [Anaerolineae bacterium]|nr:rhodanese-like domain-containing protein [Anaerolineae bacterium]
MAKRNLFFILILVTLLALTAVACGSTDDAKSNNKAATYKTLNPKTAYERISSSDNAILLDVREPDEWNTGYPYGSTLISLGDIKRRAPNELPKEADIYVICRNGNRSQEAAIDLISLGYQHVYQIRGGVIAWQQADLPMIVP